MQCDKITLSDIEQIAELQPKGWSDISSEFRFFVSNDFCNPIKISIDNKIVGVGNSIIFKNTAWLAHIIVGNEHRNKGLGFQLVENLLYDLKDKSIDTISLIATTLGEPVYKKFGFRVVSDYIYLEREKPWIEKKVSDKIFPYENNFYKKIMELDQKISGEEREPLLKKYIDSSFVYIDNKEIKGFLIPTLGEGQIFADTAEAGIELMNMKYATIVKAVIPFENQIALEFLKQNGFGISETKGKRMILGNDLNWQPSKFFSRIGGDYG
jgi:GNAT superfamily N-acetyltransferase